MKKVITLICIALSAILILDTFNVWHAAIMFYLAGQIPGTRTSVNPETMLSFFALLIGFVVARVANHFSLMVIDRIAPKRSTQRA